MELALVAFKPNIPFVVKLAFPRREDACREARFTARIGMALGPYGWRCGARCTRYEVQSSSLWIVVVKERRKISSWPARTCVWQYLDKIIDHVFNLKAILIRWKLFSDLLIFNCLVVGFSPNGSNVSGHPFVTRLLIIILLFLIDIAKRSLNSWKPALRSFKKLKATTYPYTFVQVFILVSFLQLDLSAAHSFKLWTLERTVQFSIHNYWFVGMATFVFGWFAFL